jgi:hypothetical protein
VRKEHFAASLQTSIAMSGEGMPKRTRADTSDHDTPARPAEVIEVADTPPMSQPSEVEEVTQAVPDHAGRDPLLEQQLDALDIDDDFRESIRAMTPNTRRDVLNDIIRHQQHTSIEEGLHAFGGPLFALTADAGMDHRDGSLEHSDEHDLVNDDEEEEEDAWDLGGGGHRSDRGEAMFFRHPPRFFGGRPVVPDGEADTGRPRVYASGEEPTGPLNIIDFLQLVTQHMAGPPLGLQGMRGRAAARQQQTMLEERMLNLQNLLGMLQQANAMQSMGLDRDIDDMSYEELLELEERIGNVSKGVPPALLESCMKQVEVSTTDETCPICQEELHSTATTSANKGCVKLLNCPHVFHKACIKQWLSSNKTCPVCKQEVLPQPAASSA